LVTIVVLVVFVIDVGVTFVVVVVVVDEAFDFSDFTSDITRHNNRNKINPDTARRQASFFHGSKDSQVHITTLLHV